MGSSMIGMRKDFLISEADYSGIIQTIREDTGIDARWPGTELCCICFRRTQTGKVSRFPS